MPQGEGHRGDGHHGEGHRGEAHRAEAHRGEKHQGEGYRADCRHQPIQSAAADTHPHLRFLRLPQLLTELAPLGEVFAASQTPDAPAH